MAESTLSVRLLVDEEKHKVVLAEAGKEFVDVLFSFLTMPMGTIVRLLEKHQTSQPTVVGCFNNLYRSVREMDIGYFQSEACKRLLLYPKSAKEDQCRRLTLNIDDTEPTKYFICSIYKECTKTYTNVNTLRCSYCGELMKMEVPISLGEVFMSADFSFIIMDDLTITINSMGLILKAVRGQGYTDFDKLGEMLIDVGSSEVLTLLGCLFSSDTPLTDAFLRKQSSQVVTRVHNLPTLAARGNGDDAELDTITLDVLVTKQDRKIIYVECGNDFIDLLFTFLVVPLESAWKMSGATINLGCIGNLHKCFKGLSCNKGINESTSKFVLPPWYSCPTQLLDFVIQQPPIAHRAARFVNSVGTAHSSSSGGFVKRDKKFVVYDDLFITPRTSTICLLNKLKMNFDDIEEQVIRISKREAISLLGASLMTSSALTTVLCNLLPKKPKEET